MTDPTPAPTELARGAHWRLTRTHGDLRLQVGTIHGDAVHGCTLRLSREDAATLATALTDAELARGTAAITRLRADVERRIASACCGDPATNPGCGDRECEIERAVISALADTADALTGEVRANGR